MSGVYLAINNKVLTEYHTMLLKLAKLYFEMEYITIPPYALLSETILFDMILYLFVFSDRLGVFSTTFVYLVLAH